MVIKWFQILYNWTERIQPIYLFYYNLSTLLCVYSGLNNSFWNKMWFKNNLTSASSIRTSSLKPKKKRKKKKSTTKAMIRGKTNGMNWANNLRGTKSRISKPPMLKRGSRARSRVGSKRGASVKKKRKKKGTGLKKKKKKGLGIKKKKKKKGLGTKKKKKKILKKKKIKSKGSKLIKSLLSTPLF